MSNSYRTYEVNMSKLPRLIKKIEQLEYEFRYCLTVGDFKNKLEIEKELGHFYLLLMDEVQNNGLERIYLVGDMYEIFMKTG